ncbi:hypothetical protein F4811DRAFT_47621 [Daldinia bambusicola]|nr:hypothetical protein F4811DRAFT_47621 [Daldinia bambusicola]
MSLLRMPNELLLQVMKYFWDSRNIQALQAVACTCQVLRDISEAYLYSTATFTKLSTLYTFLDAATRVTQRRNHLRSLKLPHSAMRRHDPFYAPPYLPDLTLFPNLESFASESPVRNPQPATGTHCELFNDHYMQAFTQASLINEVVETPRPLQRLRSLTLYWTSKELKCWDIEPTSPIFLLPQLQSLEISGANIGQKSPVKSETEMLQRLQHQTALKSLIFKECAITIKALSLILSFPMRLLNLTLCEKFRHYPAAGDSFAFDDTDAFNRAISQQRGSLKSLHIERSGECLKNGKVLVLSLSNFATLSHLQLGPFLQTEINYDLRAQVPPALKYLRLIEYGVSMLQVHRANKVFSDMSVEALLANSEKHGLPFTLDISLQYIPLVLHRPLFDFDGARPDIRQLINRFENRFQELQNASTHLRWEERSKSSIRQMSSRLRILSTNRRKNIPGVLRSAGQPKFIVRYDSSHPERFPSIPSATYPLALDKDFNGNDEDINIDFHSVDRTNHNLFT